MEACTDEELEALRLEFKRLQTRERRGGRVSPKVAASESSGELVRPQQRLGMARAVAWDSDGILLRPDRIIGRGLLTMHWRCSMKFILCVCAIVGVLAAIPAAAGQPDADNTEKNVRDRDERTLTPMDQGGSAADRELTAAIRKAIVDDDALSTNAHNVKIVSVGGVVTLRGPVKSPAEKAAVAAKAERTQGVKRVDNQLEVEAK